MGRLEQVWRSLKLIEGPDLCERQVKGVELLMTGAVQVPMYLKMISDRLDNICVLRSVEAQSNEQANISCIPFRLFEARPNLH